MKDIKEKIKELIYKVGNEAEYKISSRLGIKKKGNKYKCCFGSHIDKNPSMSWNNEEFYFKCFTCSETLNIYTYETKYNNKKPYEVFEEYDIYDDEIGSEIKNNILPKKEIKKIDSKQINFESTALNNVCIDYIISRGISIDAIKHFKIGMVKDLISLNYFNEDGKIIGQKLRKPKKISKNENSSKYISTTGSNFNYLYNQNNISENAKFIFVTEGEFDTISLWDSGIKNVVSIPTGANSTEKVFKNQKTFFNKFNKIFVWTDNDKAGLDSDKKFKNEFGDKAIIVNKSLMKECKDINELLFKYGKNEVYRIAKITMVNNKNLINVDDFTYDEFEEVSYIPTGFETINNKLNDLATGKLTIVTGYTGQGKTCFIENIQNMAIESGYKILVIDGEHTKENKISNSYLKLIGNYDDLVYTKKINKREIIEPNEIGINLLKKWHNKKFFLYSSCYEKKRRTRMELFEMIENSVECYDIKLIVIDNIMSLNVIETEDKNESQKLFVEKCQQLAKKYNVHVLLCCHPKKPSGSELNEYDISGSSDIPNYADNIIHVGKCFENEEIEKGYSGFIKILKNRAYSDLAKVYTYYNQNTKSLYEIKNGIVTIPSYPKFEEIKNKFLNGNYDGKTIKEIEEKINKFEYEEDLPWEN